MFDTVLNVHLNGYDIRWELDKINVTAISISAECSVDLRDQALLRDVLCIKTIAMNSD